MSQLPEPYDCQSCGACCAHDANWPRFSLESDEALALLPPELVALDESGMRCEAERCCALEGRVGEATRCTVYALRPEVCRSCVAGGDDCHIARASAGLPIWPMRADEYNSRLVD